MLIDAYCVVRELSHTNFRRPAAVFRPCQPQGRAAGFPARRRIERAAGERGRALVVRDRPTDQGDRGARRGRPRGAGGSPAPRRPGWSPYGSPSRSRSGGPGRRTQASGAPPGRRRPATQAAARPAGSRGTADRRRRLRPGRGAGLLLCGMRWRPLGLPPGAPPKGAATEPDRRRVALPAITRRGGGAARGPTAAKGLAPRGADPAAGGGIFWKAADWRGTFPAVDRSRRARPPPMRSGGDRLERRGQRQPVHRDYRIDADQQIQEFPVGIEHHDAVVHRDQFVAYRSNHV